MGRRPVSLPVLPPAVRARRLEAQQPLKPLPKPLPTKQHQCIVCLDELPEGARFCINCGHAVANTGKTERLS